MRSPIVYLKPILGERILKMEIDCPTLIPECSRAKYDVRKDVSYRRLKNGPINPFKCLRGRVIFRSKVLWNIILVSKLLKSKSKNANWSKRVMPKSMNSIS